MLNLFTRIRSAFGGVFVVVYTFICSFFVIMAGFLGLTALSTQFMRVWAYMLLWVFGIGVRIHGEENLPQAGGGILVFNHQSHFDIPSVIMSTRKNIRFGAKIELFKIPFFGAAMRSVGTLPIARENRTEVMHIYKEAAKRFKENIIFVLAPEGTRQKQPAIGRFKKGPFYFAINAQVPVIPCVIRGALDVLPKGSLSVNVGRLSRTIDIDILAPISTKGISLDHVEDITENVRAQMVAAYAKPQVS